MGNYYGVLCTIALTVPAVLLVTGCSASLEPDSTNPAEVELRTYLGGPGAHFGAISCPTVVGFFGRAGTFLESVGLVCGGGNHLWTTFQYGGDGGDSFYLTCPRGFVASGITGDSGKYISSMQLICRSDTGSKYFTESKGGGSGSSYDIECSDDEKLVGFNLEIDAYVNGVEPVCGLL